MTSTTALPSRRASLQALQVLAIGLLVPGLAQAQPLTVPSERIDFKPGSRTATRRGTLRGPKQDVRDFVVALTAGQRLTVSLASSKPNATSFNVLPPASDEALYRGELEGKARWEGDVVNAGDHVVRVFLNRAAARRGGVSNFTLTVSVR